RDEIDAELALWRFNRRIGLARWHVKAFGVELEVVNQRLHGALHLASPRRRYLVIGRTMGPAWHPRDALLDDPEALAHLLHSDEISVVAIAVPADGNIELHSIVGHVGLRLAQIPVRARGPQHGAREPPVERLGQGHHANIDQTLLEDPVLREQ